MDLTIEELHKFDDMSVKQRQLASADAAKSKSNKDAESIDAELMVRVHQKDVHPTGPLHGRGDPPVQGACRQLEHGILAAYTDWCAGLETAGLKQDRRALRLMVQDLCWQRTGTADLLLEFSLPAGAYATCVLRELILAAMPVA